MSACPMNGFEKGAAGIVYRYDLSHVDFDLFGWALRQAPDVFGFGNPEAAQLEEHRTFIVPVDCESSGMGSSSQASKC